MKRLNKQQLAALEDELYDNLSEACWGILKETHLSDSFRHCVQNTFEDAIEHLG
jgi:hypothetical protein